MQTTTQAPAAAADGQPARSRNNLLRVLGFGFGIAVIVGNTVGSGILRVPGEIARSLPDPMWFVGIWLLGGLITLTAAASYAELSAMLPRSAGQYTFTLQAWGRFPGMIIGWADWMGCTGANAASAVVIAEYAGHLYAPLRGHETLTAIALAIAFAALQWRGVRVGANTQNITTAIKAIAIVAFVLLCFTADVQPAQTAPSTLTMPQGTALMAAILLGLQSMIFSYDGYSGIIYFAEETKNPERDVPRSIFGGTLAIIAVYFFVNLALLQVASVEQMAGSSLAMGTAANVLWGANGERVLYAAMGVLLLSGMNAYAMMTCRILYSMSVDRLLPKWIRHVNAGGTPDVALALSAALTVVLLLTGSFGAIVSILSLCYSLQYVLALGAVFKLRRDEPDRPRPYRAWGYPFTTAIALLVYLSILVGVLVTDPKNSLICIALLAASYPLYWVALRRPEEKA